MKIKTKHPDRLLAALGIDPFVGYYRYHDGHLEVEGLTDAEIAAAEAQLDEAALDAEAHTEEIKEKRRAEYPPVGDQLDAIWKQLSLMRMQGEDLVQDADDMLGAILAVKRKYPKD